MGAVDNIPTLCALGPVQSRIVGKVPEKWGYNFQVRSIVFNRQNITMAVDLSTMSSTHSCQGTYIVYMSSSLCMNPQSQITSRPAMHSCLISMDALVPWMVHIFLFTSWRPAVLHSGIRKARSHKTYLPYAPWI